MDRILCFDAALNMQKYRKINVGKAVPEMMTGPRPRARRRQAPEPRHRAGDSKRGHNDPSAFERILVSEEEHIDWLEAQLRQIKDIGAESDLAQQIDGA